MADLSVHTVINSRYQVFDRSGALPFSIVLGICRRSAQDADPRPFRLSTTHSILNVPYALSHKLLTLHEYDPESKRQVEVHVGQLNSPGRTEEKLHLTLPSPVGRTESWKKRLSIYRYRIDPGDELASLLKPGKWYTLQNKSGGDVGVGAYANVDEEGYLSTPREEQKLRVRSSRADGWASFQVVLSLRWPPRIQTRMQRHQGGGDDSTNHTEGNATKLDITVINTGTQAITVRTRSRQRFLVPRGPIQPEEHYPPDDPRPRIIDTKTPAPAATLQVIDMATETIVREATKPCVCGLCRKHDPRPKLEVLTTLRPGEPLVRHVDVSGLLSRLPDGKYGLRMEPRGIWWCFGDARDFESTGEERVPWETFRTMVPPLMLECDDVVEVQVKEMI